MRDQASSTVQVCVLASGSAGNCTYVGDGTTGVLVDTGVSARQVLLRMQLAGLSEAPIDAVLITHEHRDHVQGARVLAKRIEARDGRPLPFHMTAGTMENLPDAARPSQVLALPEDGRLQLGAINVQPFSVTHDVADPVGYRLEIDGFNLAIATDLGRATAIVSHHLSDLDLAVLEFNHDEELLLQGSYPWWLKQRVRSNHGHLSNAQAAALLGSVASPRLKHLLLAHLSQENNRPARALAAAPAARPRGRAPRAPPGRAAAHGEPTAVITLEQE